jgi:hypothetical protein
MVGKAMRSWVRWSAWFCAALMLWAAAVESTHIHPTAAESASCSICVVAHSSSPTINSSPAAPVFSTIWLLQEEDIVAKTRFEFSELDIRGPPAI